MDIAPEVRAKIAKDFQLQKTGRMGVQNNKIIADGYTQTDLLKINLHNLQTLMDSSVESFDDLFLEYSDLVHNSMTLINTMEEMTADMNTIEEFKISTPVVIPPQEEVYNPNVAVSGDKETYFGTKIKPVTYKPNGKKNE